MTFWKRITKFANCLVGTAALVARDNFVDVAMALTMPQVNNKLQLMFPPRPQSAFLSQRLAARTVDGAVLEGQEGWQKLAIRKGLPDSNTKEKRLGIENEPHRVDGFSGKIEEGYGKGTKQLLTDETVVVKVNGQTRFARLNYHQHDAERAGLHYDLVVEGVRPGTPKWELHVPRGDYKGRYAFIQTPRGMLINLMRDHGEQFAKPAMTLKDEAFLDYVQANRSLYDITGKKDGASASVTIANYRAHFRSHRDGGQTYYDRLPELEFINNRAPFMLYRKLFPGPGQNGTKLVGELVHLDGAARQGGILNSLPDKAVKIQIERGHSEFYAWDIERFRGRDLSRMSFAKRERYLNDAIAEIGRYNRHYHSVEHCPDSMTAREFYEYIVAQDLPHGEGVVIKPKNSIDRSWIKIKRSDTIDLKVVKVLEGKPGTKYEGSAGSLIVEGPTGEQGRVGSFRVDDQQRQWIFDNQDLLEGQIAEIEAFEMTERGVPRAGRFVRWHPSKSEGALLMYAETLSGGESREAMMNTKYALIQAVRRAA
jgi:hypothetical protein